MNKLKKILIVCLLNILFISVIWVGFDFVVYKNYLNFYEKNVNNSFSFYKKNDNPTIYQDLLFSKKIPPENGLKKPTGLQYKTTPVTLFGCSFAYGQYLKENKTFQYKLSEILKRPVYNRSFPGHGLQHMYYDTSKDFFYEQIPPCDTVIYVFIYDHFRRMLCDSFNVNEFLYLHYNYKNGDLIMDNYKNPFAVLYKRSYLIRLLRAKYQNRYIEHDHINSDKLTDEALAYFIKTRENLEKRWSRKINFVVLMYVQYDYADSLFNNLREKLENNGFIVVTTKDLTKENLSGEKYILPDTHPNEAAWDLITPLFVKKLKELKVF